MQVTRNLSLVKQRERAGHGRGAHQRAGRGMPAWPAGTRAPRPAPAARPWRHPRRRLRRRLQARSDKISHLESRNQAGGSAVPDTRGAFAIGHPPPKLPIAAPAMHSRARLVVGSAPSSGAKGVRLYEEEEKRTGDKGNETLHVTCAGAARVITWQRTRGGWIGAHQFLHCTPPWSSRIGPEWTSTTLWPWLVVAYWRAPPASMIGWYRVKGIRDALVQVVVFLLFVPYELSFSCMHACMEVFSEWRMSRVNRTGGNRSYRFGPVPVPAGSQPVPIQNLNLNSNNEKKSHKILKNTSRCVESNGVKNFQIFVHLV
jgi:hypothetical protein